MPTYLEIIYRFLSSLPLVAYVPWHWLCDFHSSNRALEQLRHDSEAELLRHDDILADILSPSIKKVDVRKDAQHDRNLHQFGILQDLDRNPALYHKIMINLSSCPPQLVAELRAWQQAAHVIAAIDTVLSYTSKTQSETNDPIRNAMINAIFAFPSVQQPIPAQPRPDDLERVTDRRVLFDEPHMQTLIRSLDDQSRIAMKEAADRERARLPLFPAHFKDWEPLTEPPDNFAEKQS